MLVRGRGSPLRGRKKGLFTKKNIFISHLRFDKKGGPKGPGDSREQQNFGSASHALCLAVSSLGSLRPCAMFLAPRPESGMQTPSSRFSFTGSGNFQSCLREGISTNFSHTATDLPAEEGISS